ncbi:glycine tRNA synthetase, beta subunit [Acetoanaerobium sticklandii]|uniref:Glycine--tRNA ligase beta subunit n=1 Tax=Acetoanaerobium sticklandii (strain ATCC 12662 / DSM 519 / JCM 1433 / CCUG 9281 / NCIMB 10654 / HF) TaxID=499177 RepID=E3PSN6_ACESD|nr:glycine--tRNA ligase subunit beta [Acetoanaerobium sticklandii]CBH21890.1 glycine tRNA synthetase, beta subunit [Acetoanaerobium sticklandii]
MNKKLLFEIGTEEIPARFIAKTKADMKGYLEKTLKELHIEYKSIELKCTPRRFVVVIDELAENQATVEEELKGPAKKIAFDENNNPSKALLGFLKGKDISPEEVYFKTVGKDEYAHIKLTKEGQAVKGLLKDIFEGMIKSTTFPKSMRWGGKNIRFVRPIRYFVCLMDEEVIDFEIEGIKTGNITKGHRFLGSSEIVINTPDEYEAKLKENFVILDDEQRKSLILEQCKAVADSLGGTLMMDEDLLEEVNYIVEYPTAFYGEFDESYLSLPKEAIITPMKEHQRYFPVLDADGKLLNKFITVRNGDSYAIDNVKRGNEKVLDARLSDALFFYHEDTKKPLEAYVERLDTIVFQQKLGTILDKTKRIQNLSEKIAKALALTLPNLDRAAYLSKADLTTAMVFEFTELQGIMGRYYANLSNEPSEVAEAIYEHYLPRFAGDELPSTNEGIILALSDRLDSVAGFFAIGIQPTGSQDPYALRRQALGILNIMMEKKLDVRLFDLLDLALENFDFEDMDKQSVKSDLMSFFELRLKNLFTDMGIRYDVVDAIINIEDSNPFDLLIRAKDLDAWVKNNSVTEALQTFSRISNISKEAVAGKVDEALFAHDSEAKLNTAYNSIKAEVEAMLARREYVKALELLISIKDSVDAFFDSVMIMDENMDIRANRLAMLSNIRTTMESVADLSKIVNA